MFWFVSKGHFIWVSPRKNTQGTILQMEADSGEVNRNFPNDFRGTGTSSNIYFLNIPQLCRLVKKKNPNNTHKEHKKDFSAEIYLGFFVKLSPLQCRHAAPTDFGRSRAYSCGEEFDPWAWCPLSGLEHNHQTLWIVVLFLLPMCWLEFNIISTANLPLDRSLSKAQPQIINETNYFKCIDPDRSFVTADGF